MTCTDRHSGFARTRFARTLFALLTAALFSAPALAEKIVDPRAVAPEFREAAEKRRAEQVKILNCNAAAMEAKIPRRDLAKHVSDCLEK